MNNQLLISIIIPVFNNFEYLPLTIKSIYDQTFHNFEVIVVDDGSTDPDYSKIHCFEKFSNFHFVRLANQGPAAARNFGINMSIGRYIAFIDSDDMWINNKLESQILIFKSNPSIDVVYTSRFNVDSESNLIENSYSPKIISGYLLNDLFIDNCITMSSAIVKRSVFDTVGFFDENLRVSSDWDFWLRASVCCNFYGIDEKLVYYRIHQNQISSGQQKRRQAIDLIRNKFIQNNGELISTIVRAKAYSSRFLSIASQAEKNNEKIHTFFYLYLMSFLVYPFSFFPLKQLVKALLPTFLIHFFTKINKLNA